MAKVKKKAKVIPMRGKTKAAPEGDHVRILAPVSAVRSIISDVIATKAAVSEAGQGLGEATKRFANLGGNVPAARLAARVYGKAKQDPITARVLWEDMRFYLEECTDFLKICPAGMFTPTEAGQRRPDEDAPLVGEPPMTKEVRESA